MLLVVALTQAWAGQRQERELPGFEVYEPDPIGVVISGGVTRGAYQGGQVWVITETLKKAKQGGFVEDVAFAGSSAGSINAVLAASSLVHEGPVPVPEQSIFFRTWVPMGLTNDERSVDYHPPDYAPVEHPEVGLQLAADDGVITHKAFTDVLDGWSVWWEEGDHVGAFDEVLVGLTATRLQADTDQTGMTREVNEAFAFQLEKSGDEARIRDLECPAGEQKCDAERMTLQYRRHTVPYRAMAAFVKPSSGIPVAFPLWSIACDAYLDLSLWPRDRCHLDPREETPILLIDGGTFDGNPMEVARRLTAGPGRSDPEPFFIFLDPDLGYRPEAPDVLPADASAAERVEALLLGFVTTARMQKLTEFRRDRREDFEEETLFVQTRSEPIASYLGNFFGIFDRSFRVWDFYAGAHDTVRQIDEVAQGAAVVPKSAAFKAVTSGLPIAHEPSVRKAWREGVGCGKIRSRLAQEVDQAFVDTPDAAFEEAADAVLIEEHRSLPAYPTPRLRRNLRTLAYVGAIRILGSQERGCSGEETFDEDWFAGRLSKPFRVGDHRFDFEPVELGARRPKACAQGEDCVLAQREYGRFDRVLRSRLSWMYGYAIDEKLVVDDMALEQPLRLARSMALSPRAQWTFMAGTVPYDGALFNLGVGLDTFPAEPRFLSGSARILLGGGVTPADEGAQAWSFDARVGVLPLNLWRQQGLIGPLNGPVAPDLGFFVRGAFATGGTDPIDNLNAYYGWVGTPEHWGLGFGPELKVHAFGMSSLALGAVVAPTFEEWSFQALLAVHMPMSSLHRPARARWRTRPDSLAKGSWWVTTRAPLWLYGTPNLRGGIDLENNCGVVLWAEHHETAWRALEPLEAGEADWAFTGAGLGLRWLPHPRELPGGTGHQWGGLVLEADAGWAHIAQLDARAHGIAWRSSFGYAWHLRDRRLSPVAKAGIGVGGEVWIAEDPEHGTPRPELVLEIGARRQKHGPR